MILGASHLVLTTADPESDEQALHELGWKTRFAERVAARSEKERFLSEPSDGEQLTLLERRGQVALELITYRAAPAAEPIASLVMPGKNEAGDHARGIPESLRAALQATGHAFSTGQLPGGESHFSVSKPEAPALVHRSREIGPVSEFYTRALGFEKANSPQELVLRRPFAHWSMRLLLVEDPEVDARGSSLDAPGVRCLSFISSDLAADRQRLLEFPAVESTGPMAYEIAGRALQIEIFRAPGGLYVELLQAGRV